MQALSYRHRAQLGPEVRAVYALYEQYGAPDLLAAMALATEAGTYSAAALALLLSAPAPSGTALPLLRVPGVPAQEEIDRHLSTYDLWMPIDDAHPEVAS